MIGTAKAIYKDGRLIFYNTEEIPEDGAEVIVNFEKQSKTSAFSLRGSWAKYFPKEVDLEKELQNLRKEWEKEIAEITETEGSIGGQS